MHLQYTSEHKRLWFKKFAYVAECRKYELDDDTIDFIGHALALHIDDTYLDQPALHFVKRVKVRVVLYQWLFLLCSLTFLVLNIECNTLDFNYAQERCWLNTVFYM